LKRRENTFLIKDSSSRLLKAFIPNDKMDHGFELVGLEFENTGDYPVTLGIDYDIVEKRSGDSVDWLQNLRDEQGFDTRGIHSRTLIKPHTRQISLIKISSLDSGMRPASIRNTFLSGCLQPRINLLISSDRCP
jgi:hypothetical protein